MKKCIVCGDQFEPKNPKGVYCSPKCKMRDARAKKKPPEKAKPEIKPENKVHVRDLNTETVVQVKGISSYDLERRLKKCGF